jgi:hypothetical protein
MSHDFILPESTPPEGIIFFQEWRRIVFDKFGTHWGELDSGWYDEATARVLYDPDPPNGWTHVLETRWVSEVRTDA